VIAQPLPEAPRPRVGTRAGRGAVPRRHARARRKRYVGVVRILACVTLATVGIVIYLGLMANVTRMNYELSRNARTRAVLLDETSRLDDRLSRLTSHDRLLQIGKSLGMREPLTMAVVKLPSESRVEPDRLALLTSLAAWFR
jgi:hypothetical protein